MAAEARRTPGWSNCRCPAYYMIIVIIIWYDTRTAGGCQVAEEADCLQARRFRGCGCRDCLL